MLYQFLMKLKLCRFLHSTGVLCQLLGQFLLHCHSVIHGNLHGPQGIIYLVNRYTDPPLSELEVLSWAFSFPLALGDRGESLLAALLLFCLFLWRLRLFLELVFVNSCSRGTPSLACALVTTFKETTSSLPDVGGDGMISTRCKLEVDGPAGFARGFGLLGQFLLKCSM